MLKNRAGSVVLVNGRKKPVVIVTERDLVKVSAPNKLPENMAAKNIMSSPVVTIKAYGSIETAAALMAEQDQEACRGGAEWGSGRSAVYK
ncbi:MAG TPA: CBS domain-containing protein [Nitrososphaera sp.]|nr:CBS domain-containing protein [Nitrososphaera sp.]